jgi:hypothetical protein
MERRRRALQILKGQGGEKKNRLINDFQSLLQAWKKEHGEGNDDQPQEGWKK